MNVVIHQHAKARMYERGVTEAEVVSAVSEGERFPVKFGRTGFRRNFSFAGQWRGHSYGTKQVEVFAVKEGNDWLVITVVARYF